VGGMVSATPDGFPPLAARYRQSPTASRRGRHGIGNPRRLPAVGGKLIINQLCFLSNCG